MLQRGCGAIRILETLRWSATKKNESHRSKTNDLRLSYWTKTKGEIRYIERVQYTRTWMCIDIVLIVCVDYTNNCHFPVKWLKNSCNHCFSVILGKNYAILEMKILLVHIIRNFRIVSVTRREEFEPTWEMMLRPTKPISVKFIPRQLIKYDVVSEIL